MLVSTLERIQPAKFSKILSVSSSVTSLVSLISVMMSLSMGRPFESSLSEVRQCQPNSKCEFNKSSLAFFGFVFSKEGISPDPDKFCAIHNMTPPTSVSEVRSFLGMATYSAKFIPSFSDISFPLHELTKRSTSCLSTRLHLRRSKRC